MEVREDSSSGKVWPLCMLTKPPLLEPPESVCGEVCDEAPRMIGSRIVALPYIVRETERSRWLGQYPSFG